jgi:polysaccharide export outer membrane protein
MKSGRFAAPLLVALAAFGTLLIAPARAQQAAAQAAAPTATQAASVRTGVAASDYRLGPGDIVHITVFQNPDLTLDSRISESGLVSYPLLGAIRLGGLSTGQAEKLIADGLRDGNFLKQPQVSVLLTQVRGNQASVLGQVNRPGRFPIEVSGMRLTDLMALASGIAGSGADTVTLIGTRDGKPFRKEVDLPLLFKPGHRDDDVLIQDGDVAYVERAPLVYIYGEVQRPGAMRLERDMLLMQVLANGGGVTQRGTEKGIKLHRRGADGKVEVLEPKMDDTLREGDVVYVRESLF